ncbi:uncharacterized protein BP01DRAFT_301044 [Aspergillus saccharolyticus JOP 1030-1]|uniref:Uncharacterized protein n=1 Tax=Aspergillus saccharolyticus JOP 1030-1 TaxID=1450539 RepID=A0A319A8N9_9EURO|nr:hypothetical protein BP01DRAFT_301044 [Aspergillus saccharolyticus JOP 1030-1]PYH43442.1 hypothetical protein BP01DRAFT_301044 [Aspergillus saccharolyticus JOP 1030-1]
MPIKLPKGFARRKSSGNALEEVENPPQPSFRVFERPSTDKKSSSDGQLMSKRLSEGQPLYSPSEDADNNIFAVSENHPSRSLYTNPSAHLSQSTRRSTDGEPSVDAHSPHSRNLYDIPIPPISGALRAAGRTFSFGGRFAKVPAAVSPSQPSTPGPSRNRAMTASTANTAAAPRLPEADLQFEKMEDDFQNMFGNLEKRYYAPQDSPQEETIDSDAPRPRKSRPDNTGGKVEKAPRPGPIDTNRSQEVEPSPYSWDSRHSEDGLLAAIDSPREQLGAPHQYPKLSTGPAEERPKSAALPHAVSSAAATTSHRSLEKPQTAADKGLRRSVIYPSKRDSPSVDDEDAKLIMESLYSGKKGVHVAIASDQKSQDADNEFSLFAIENGQLSASAAQTERQEPPTLIGPAENNSLEASIAAHAQLAAQYEKCQPPSASSTNKIMTPSQFEHYRRQQELRRSKSDASLSEKSSESEYEEEDETENNREAERQRRKQEAHLSVYRQQMMKVTGQQASAPALQTDVDRASKSAPNLLQPGNLSGSGKSSDGDDDEEIPLGILAAHGFPNRNRPPSHLTPSNSIPNLRASFQQPYISSPGSVAEQDTANRSSLPVFARNLPRDPYFGASLVSPSNRESLALGGGASVHGGPSPALPPGGLVGVIATEERARAMRRGSPNTQAMYDYQAGGVSGPAIYPSGIPRPYTMMNLNSTNAAGAQSSISATEQAQIQLSQQMTQMVQMQMQWMQQMIQIQGGQNVPQIPLQGIPLQGPGSSVNVRPSSMPSAGTSIGGPSVRHQEEHRTLSMLDPNASSRLNAPALPYVSGVHRPGTPAGQNYAPSIAPSERSNVGLASRYRPVSMVQPDLGPSNIHPTPTSWNDENDKPPAVVPAGLPMSTRPLSSHNHISAHLKPSNGVAADDDDDDEGWAEMMRKREDKKNNWKMKKETSTFGDLLNAVH